MDKIGLIAGNRKFPFIFAEGARKQGLKVVAVAIKGDTSPLLRSHVDKLYWVGLNELNKMIGIFKDEGIADIVMAGQVSPARIFSKELYRDEEIKKLLDSIEDKRPDKIFGAIAKRLEDSGFRLLDSTTFIKDYLPGKRTLTKLDPDFALWEDIYFGMAIAKAVAHLDIGQTVAVRSKAIVAVEALEGTDNLIRRAGSIARGGITVVKVSKPKQDMRFDIPVVGLNTIKNLIRAGGRCLAIEADKTLFIDREKSVRLADRKGICIVAV